jgi:hypothetical protein
MGKAKRAKVEGGQRGGEGEESQKIRERKSMGGRVQGVRTLYYQRVSVLET